MRSRGWRDGALPARAGRMHMTIPLSLSLALALSGTAAADDTKTIGIDGGIALPTGNWSNAAGIGIGALGRFGMPVAAKTTFSARLGLVYHTSKDTGTLLGGNANVQLSEIPLLGGLRYDFTPGFYGAAELGFVITSASVSVNGMSASSS